MEQRYVMLNTRDGLIRVPCNLGEAEKIRKLWKRFYTDDVKLIWDSIYFAGRIEGFEHNLHDPVDVTDMTLEEIEDAGLKVQPWVKGWKVETEIPEPQARTATELHLDSEFEQWVLDENPEFAKKYKAFPLEAPVKKEGDDICTM